MTVRILDTTILSNFAHTKQVDLLAGALPDVITTTQIMDELLQGEAVKRLPVSNWQRLTVVSLSADEVAHFEGIRQVLDDGEASCLAVAYSRNGVFLSDDRDARRYAQRLDVPISGTLGVLALLVKNQQVSLTEADKLLQAMIQAGYRSPINSLAEVYRFGD
jgi:predicted nucleic acid-binding protein